jgi:hypothetical protein
MSFLGLFADQTVIQESLGATKVTLDASISENTQLSVTVTDHPIEDGSDVTDHVRDDPDQIQIDGIVSRTPVENPVSLLLESSYRHESAWLQLGSWLKSHTLLKVKTSVKTYDSFVMLSLTRIRSADVGEALQVSMKLKQIVKVKSSEVAAPARPAGIQTPATSATGTAGAASPANSVLAQGIWH